MKKILLGVVGAVALGLVGFLGAAAMQPDVIHVERSVAIKATPADVYPLTADLKRFQEWSPWSKLDPNQKVEFSEVSSGPGAWYTWSGNDQVGSGKMTITEVVADKQVKQDLEFITPFAASAKVSFSLEAQGEETKATWTMDQNADLMSKAMCLVVDMDQMLGADFDKGLASLKGLSEEAAAARVEAEKKAAAEAEAAAQAAAQAPVENLTPVP